MRESFHDSGIPELPNRLSVADLNPTELMQITGTSLREQELAKDNYNWLAAYLVEEVGLYEEEAAEWFKWQAAGLDGERPIDVWSRPDVYLTVFEYAQRFRTQIAED